MLTYEELYRLKIQPEGEDKIRSLEAALRSEQAALAALTTAGAQATAAWKQQAKAVEDLERQVVRARVGFEQFGAGFRGPNGMMQIGYFLDDIQYGINGVANNIPGLLQAVGVAGKFAGALSIGSAAAVLLYGQWGNLMDLFGLGGTKTEAERMEELGKQTEKTAAETAKLARYQENLSNQQAQRGKSKGEAEHQADFNAAVVEAGGDEMVRGLVQIRRARYANGDPETAKLEAERKTLEKKMTTMRQMGYGPDQMPELTREHARVNAAVEDRIDKAARKDLAAAATDPAKAKVLADLVAANPGAFGAKGAGFVDAMGKRDRDAADALAKRDMASQDAEDKAANDMAEQARMDRIDGEIDATDAKDAANQAAFAKGRKKKFEAAKDSGLGPLIAEQLADAMQHGGNVEALKKKLGERLTATFGLAAGPGLLNDAEKDAKRKVMGDWLKDDKTRASEVAGGGADWIKRIQGGVNGERVKELQRLDKIAAILDAQLKVAVQAKEVQQQPAPKVMVFK